MRHFSHVFRAATVVAAMVTGPVASADEVSVAVGQRGNWDTAISELGNRAGIFKKHGLDIKLLYTQGGGETIQAVVSGSVDIGVAAGTLGVLGAFSKGAPIRVVGAQATGAAEFWYVRSDSLLQSIANATADTTIAFSTNGSSSNSVVLGFINQYGLRSTPVATGSSPATFTQVMSGQVDVGWSSPPFGLKELEEGKIRIVGRANDVAAIKSQTIRTLIANTSVVDGKPDVLARYLAAYRETIDWMYSSDKALEIYAEFASIDVEIARAVRDNYIPKSLLDPDTISGTDALMADAVAYNVLAEPLSQEQLDKLIRIPPRH